MTHSDEAAYTPRRPGLHRPTAHGARTSSAGLRDPRNAAEPMPTPMRAPANNARRAPGTSETHSRRGAPGPVAKKPPTGIDSGEEPGTSTIPPARSGRNRTLAAESDTRPPGRTPAGRRYDAGQRPPRARRRTTPPAERRGPETRARSRARTASGTRDRRPANTAETRSRAGAANQHPDDPDEKSPEQPHAPHPPRPHNTKNRKGAVTPWDPSGRILRIPGAASGALTPREPSTSPGGHAGSGHRARPAPHRAGL